MSFDPHSQRCRNEPSTYSCNAYIHPHQSFICKLKFWIYTIRNVKLSNFKLTSRYLQEPSIWSVTFVADRYCHDVSFFRFPLRWRHNGHDSVSNHQPRDCVLNRLFRPRSKKTSKLRVTGLCAGNSPEAGEFPAQMASNAEDVSIWWRHHVHSVSGSWRIIVEHPDECFFQG